MFRGYVSFTEGRHPRIDMKPEEMGLMSFKIQKEIFLILTLAVYIQFFMVNLNYSPETNMSPENQWLENVFPSQTVPF